MNEIRILNKEAVQKLKSFRDNYTSQNKFFINWLEKTGKDVCEDSIREFFKILNNSGYTAATISNKREALKNYIRQLFRKCDFETRFKVKFILDEISADIRKPVIINNYNSRRDILNDDDFDNVINQCSSNRQIAFLKFLFKTGCRINEMTGIKLTDCIIRDDSVNIRVIGKFSKERHVVIERNLFDFINNIFSGKLYLFETDSGRRILNDYISKQITKVGKRANFRISAHSLRHSFGTKMIIKHPDKIDAISKYMGHASAESTLDHYIHTNLSNKDLLN